jgi:hypothetical protein
MFSAVPARAPVRIPCRTRIMFMAFSTCLTEDVDYLLNVNTVLDDTISV